ncbi:MAG: beta strand repeat-containing protein [Bacteroidales bacterium]
MARKLKGQQQTLSGSPTGTFTNYSPKPIQANRAPTSADTGYEIGQLWADTNGTTMYGLSDVSGGSATWNLLGPGDSDVDTLTGDSGGTISPSGGNITLAGGTNITSVGSGSTITFNLDAAITLATSVTSPLYTADAGSELQLTAPSGEDVVVTLGDSGGSNSFIVEAADSTEVFSVDSNGTVAFTNFSNTGTFTTSGGNASINASSNFNTVINSGTSTGTITLGNGAAGDVTVDSGSGISLDAADNSNFSVSGSGNDLTLASSAGTVIVEGGEDTADAIYLHADAGTSETIRLHSDQGTGADSVHLESDVGGITLTSTGLASSDAINLAAAAGGVDVDAALDIVLTSTEDAADSIYLHADGGTSETIRLHSDQGTGADSVHLESDVGGVTLTSTGLASADAITLNSVAGGVDVDGALQININSSQSAADAVRIVSSDAAGGIDIDSGTGGITVDSTGAISVDAADNSNFSVSGGGNDLTLASSGGTVIVNSGEDTADAIYLHADAGSSETIRLHADQGTGTDSVHLESDAGGVTLTSTGLASADAINLNAVAGGVDVDGALQINIDSSQSASDAVRLIASDSSGGVTFECGSGNVNVTGGNFVLSDVATQIEMNGGAATDFIGQATLVNGQVTVSNTNISADDRIFLTRSDINSSSALGHLVTTINAGTSFTIESKEAASPGDDETGDQSIIDYVIIKQN